MKHKKNASESGKAAGKLKLPVQAKLNKVAKKTERKKHHKRG
jgi:hypothetical protein